MVLLRRVIGDALRARRQGQHRTLREVSTAANVSLGYLSEIERGQKEASSELLAAICDALGARLSELLGEVSDTLALAEGMEGVLVPVGGSAEPDHTNKTDASMRKVADGRVSVSVHQDSPLKATLRTTRKRERDVVYAA
jgi:transcriptional regulator with XRE-family HTH domain